MVIIGNGYIIQCYLTLLSADICVKINNKKSTNMQLWQSFMLLQLPSPFLSKLKKCSDPPIVIQIKKQVWFWLCIKLYFGLFFFKLMQFQKYFPQDWIYKLNVSPPPHLPSFESALTRTTHIFYLASVKVNFCQKCCYVLLIKDICAKLSGLQFSLCSH